MSDSPVVRPLEREELAAFAAICLRAYPGLGFDLDRLTERMTTNFGIPHAPQAYGAFSGGRLLGGMNRHRFIVNFHGAETPLDGLAMVAVDLDARRRGVGRALVCAFLDAAARDGVPLTALYPFRPDFYRKLGFAYGTPLLEYRLPTNLLPGQPESAGPHVRLLSPRDGDELLACYHRVAARTHGFMQHDHAWSARLFSQARLVIAGVFEDTTLRGFTVFGYRNGASFVDNLLDIHDVIAESPGAARALYTFLRSLSDQAPTALLRTQDDQLLHALTDPRDGSNSLLPSVYHRSAAQGVGIMYRLVSLHDTLHALTTSQHRFGFRRLRVRLTLHDTLRRTRESVTLSCADGAAVIDDTQTADVTLTLTEPAAAALLIGSADLRGLLGAGLAEISDLNYTEALHAIFQPAVRPFCVSHF